MYSIESRINTLNYILVSHKCTCELPSFNKILFYAQTIALSINLNC